MNSEIFFSSFSSIMILGPHPDDMEFSCGGTISKLISLGLEIHYVVFSMCEKSVPAGMPKDIIKQELLKSTKYIGIEDDNIHLYDYEVREFPKFRQEILEDMVILNKKVKPDLVFLPSPNDLHQDHKTICEEGIRAFKYSSILGYEMPWNNFSFNSVLYVTLSEDEINKKIQGIEIYKSQQFRSYSNEDFVKSLAKLRGIQVKSNYAESFEIIRFLCQ